MIAKTSDFQLQFLSIVTGFFLPLFFVPSILEKYNIFWKIYIFLQFAKKNNRRQNPATMVKNELKILQSKNIVGV